MFAIARQAPADLIAQASRRIIASEYGCSVRIDEIPTPYAATPQNFRTSPGNHQR